MARPQAHDAITAFEQRIGYRFSNAALLREALTHASLQGPQASYERLEFLGDRVLGLTIATRLFRDFPGQGESGLAPRLNALVNRAACARAARRSDLGAALIMSPSEADQGGRDKEAILGDACEAVIAALYLDGGMDPARAFIERFWGEEFDGVRTLPRDPKTALQEWAAARKRALNYEIIERSGPEHAPLFKIEARLDGGASAQGEGGSKRDAERAAAAALLKEVGADG